MEHNSYLPLWILVLPLFGFLLNGCFFPLVSGGTNQVPRYFAGITATLVMAVVFVLSFTAFLGVSTQDRLVTHVFEWLNVGSFKFSFDLMIDRLTAVMILIISGVGTLIHLYSIGYMEHEKGVSRFFAYLNLFCFAMLLLVLSDNLIFLFFGWEGVGLCSFLLIGYWHGEEQNGAAAKKALVVNRIGDVFFILGLFVLLLHFGTLSISALASMAEISSVGVIGVATLLLFMGATGKSAQFPLFVWLPDAMAGPTPVSALIHAATMVTAGVYLAVRLSFLYGLAPETMFFIANVGAATALIGGLIALQQDDIKKVLAYSTVSQLGFMFIAVGVGALKVAIFHLTMHAFFKALLFLGSGSVIHAMGGEQNMNQMGGLKKFMPITFATMMVGGAALMGLPLFSGFFSKDAILFAAHSLPGGSFPLWGMGLLAAFLTAIYTTRLLKMTFFGELRSSFAHPHESPTTMTIPLVILGLLSAFSGFLWFPEELSASLGIHIPEYFADWLSPILPFKEVGDYGFLHEVGSTFLAVVNSLLGIFFALWLFRSGYVLPLGRKLLGKKLYFDEIYDVCMVKPVLWLGSSLSSMLEMLVQSFGQLVRVSSQWTGSRLRTIQTGDLQGSIVILSGAVLILLAIFFIW
jgi:NADH-quinone oxidoreductase subunit L